MQTPNTYRGGPDPRGHFGLYGGRYVAETLMPLILAVEAAYNAPFPDETFKAGARQFPLLVPSHPGDPATEITALAPGSINPTKPAESNATATNTSLSKSVRP